jgi:MRG-binding protein
MISIHNDMRSHGFVTEHAEHTRVSGVWNKLNQLYDLRALDDRENAYAFDDHPDPFNPEEAYSIPEFELPEEDFGELIWLRRFREPNSEASSSPPFIPIEEDKALYRPGSGLLRDLPEGSKSQKAESASGATPTPKPAKSTRATRAAATKSGKGVKAGQNAKGAKAQSAVSESTNEDDEEEEEDEDEESAESEEETAPTTRRTNRSNTQKKKPEPARRTGRRR